MDLPFTSRNYNGVCKSQRDWNVEHTFNEGGGGFCKTNAEADRNKLHSFEQSCFSQSSSYCGKK